MSKSKQKKKSGRISIPPQRRETYPDMDVLFREFYKPVQKQFHAITKDYHESEDLAQEVMIRVWRYWDKIQWDKLSGVIAVITHHVLCDFAKKRLNKPDKDFTDDELDFEYHDEGITDPLRKLVIERAADAVGEFTEILRDRNREIFLDYYTRDMKTWDIAEKYKISQNNVHVHLSRIRTLLSGCFEGYDLMPEERWENAG